MASRNVPQTLSVKRKRTELPVDSLFIERPDQQALQANGPLSPTDEAAEHDAKRAKHTGNKSFIWRRIATPHQRALQPQATPPAEIAQRTFHIDRTSSKIVLVEAKPNEIDILQSTGQALDSDITVEDAPEPIRSTEQTTAPRKRPGVRSGLSPQVAEKGRDTAPELTEDRVRAFEQFATEVEEKEANPRIPPLEYEPMGPKAAKIEGKADIAPRQYKPKAPKLRFRDRHPELAAAADAKEAIAFGAKNKDNQEYVYDTYVREPMVLDENGLAAEPQGSVGIIVITKEDEEHLLWADENDKSIDTDEDDEDDENAEDYYTNDYPEEEMSSDDEFERNPYKYFQGDYEDTYDIDDDALSDGWGHQHDSDDGGHDGHDRIPHPMSRNQ